VSALLEVRGLQTYFHTDEGILPAVDDVSFQLDRGKTLGIVGESGCGKSVASLSIMRLVPIPPGEIAGEIFFDGEDLLKKTSTEMRRIRGNEISMIFQEPLTSLNPVFTIGDQIVEAIVLHQKKSKKEAILKALEMLELVGIATAEHCIKQYPHQLSGGMRQRAMIAMALSCKPKMLIADEPTTALDVTIQAQILELIDSLRKELGMAVILITHDLGVIAEMVEQVVVMYCGKIVERTDVYTLFSRPLHPYTNGLMKAIPRINEDRESLYTIEGFVPSLAEIPKGCRFYNRCERKTERCSSSSPLLKEVEPGHDVACWNLWGMQNK
jgi:oligopeptide/dipeptide ABC transporter ATP-binding protein